MIYLNRYHSNQHNPPWLDIFEHIGRHNPSAEYAKQMEKLSNRDENISWAIQIELRDDWGVRRFVLETFARNQSRRIFQGHVEQVDVICGVVEEVFDMLLSIFINIAGFEARL